MRLVQITGHQSSHRQNKDYPMLFEQCGVEQNGQTIDPVSSVALGICAGPLVRAGLEEILKATRFVVLAEQSGLDDMPCDLLIVDEMHHPHCLASLITQLKSRHRAARVVALADQFDACDLVSARRAGVDGFCLTTSARDVLIHSLELVMLGEVVVPSDVILAIIGEVARKVDDSLGTGPETLNGSASPRRPLSSREMEILGWLKEGAPNKVIARKLNVAEATVKVHIKAILRKIGAGNRTQAAIWAADHLPRVSAIR